MAQEKTNIKLKVALLIEIDLIPIANFSAPYNGLKLSSGFSFVSLIGNFAENQRYV